MSGERPGRTPALLGEMREGDEVVVNTAALDLELGSGGFDVVHVNLTAGCGAAAASGRARDEAQLHLAPAPGRAGRARALASDPDGPNRRLPVWFCRCTGTWRRRHGRRRRRAGVEVGYVQTGGGALPGRSADVAQLRKRDSLRPHHRRARPTAPSRRRIGPGALMPPPQPPLGAAHRAGARHHRLRHRLGHGGMAALESAHSALALGLPTLLSPRLSSATSAAARGVSHHTRPSCRVLLAPVEVPVPAGEAVPKAILAGRAAGATALREAPVTSAGYAARGLPASTMGRGLEEDRMFFARGGRGRRAAPGRTALRRKG